MVDITLIELHSEDGSFSANLPFSGLTDSDDAADEDDEEAEAVEADADDDSSSSKGLAVLGVFLFLIVAAVAVKYLTGDDETPDVDIDTEDAPSVDVATSE